MFSWMVDSAYAMGAQPAAEGAAKPDPFLSLIPFVLIMVVFYFLMIRPQQKRIKEHKAMVEGIKKGDEIVTSGGLLGRVTGVADEYLTVEIAPDVKVRVQKGAVTVMNKTAN